MSASSDGDEEAAMLPMLVEKIMHQPIKDDLLTYCPTMDLIALVTIDEQIHIFRLNGQRVTTLPARKDCESTHLRWKPDGRLLAVAFSDNVISFVNPQTGKAVHHTFFSALEKSRIHCLSWSVNFLDVQSVKSRLNELEDEISLDDVIYRGLKGQASGSTLDLPADLAFLELEESLPRLSVLPAGGKDDVVFSSRIAIDAIFHSTAKDYDESVDVLIIGFEQNLVDVSIYDTFRIGSLYLQQPASTDASLRVLRHSSHPYCSTHSLLLESYSKGQRELVFSPLDLRLIPNSGRYLSLLAKKSTQLNNLLRYIGETAAQIRSEFRAAQDLPIRFIRNIEETLQEKEQCSFVAAAYHLVATGHCFPSVKEWLVDELGDRGQKRWDKAVTTGYENIRRLTHESLIPALERVCIIVSRLRGLSKVSESSTAFGIVTPDLDHILDSLDCLQLCAHTILLFTCAELRQFTAFSAWMRHEIDVQSAEPSSLAAEELETKDPMLDYQEILDYVQGAMQQSKLSELLDHARHIDQGATRIDGPDDSSIYPLYKSGVMAFRKGLRSDSQVLGLAELFNRLDMQCKVVASKIAETQKRQMTLGEPITLHGGGSRPSDMRMISENDDDPTLCTTYIAIVDEKSTSAIIHRITIRVINGVSSTQSLENARVDVSHHSSIQDVTFIDDTNLMLLIRDPSNAYLVYLAYRDTPSLSAPSLVYERTVSGHARSGRSLDLSNHEIFRRAVRHTFLPGPSWSPKRVEVNGRKGRRVICAMAEDSIHYRIFELD